MNELLPPTDGLVHAFWVEKARLLGLDDSETPSAWGFGATAEQANELLTLVLSGVKTATSSALWSYEAEEEPLPTVGDLSIVCDAAGTPQAVLRVTHVTVAPFNEVPASHAQAEGEGDRSLDHWRREHEVFFRTHLPAGREFAVTMPVVLERFQRL